MSIHNHFVKLLKYVKMLVYTRRPSEKHEFEGQGFQTEVIFLHVLYTIVWTRLGCVRRSDKKNEFFRKLCWETMFGQELVKLTIMDQWVHMEM